MRGFNRFRYAILPILLVLFLLPALPSFGSVEAQTATSSPSTVASLAGPPIQFTETSDYIRLNSTLFTVEFYKGTAGYNIIYDKLGNVLVHNDRIVLEYRTGKQWKQRGTPTGISWVEIDDYWYNVTRHYTDYLGTEYNITYIVKSNSPIKITVSLKFGQKDNYRLAWYPSGITKTVYTQEQYRLVFGRQVKYKWVGFDWSDVFYNFGNITEVSVEDVANGKKANIYFNIGEVEAGQTVTVDPSIVATTSYEETMTCHQRKTFHENGYFWVFYYDSSDDTLKYKSSSNGLTWSSPVTVATGLWAWYDFDIFLEDDTTIHLVYTDSTTNFPIYTTYYMKGTLGSGTITWGTAYVVVSGVEVDIPSITLDTNGYPWVGYRNVSNGVDYVAVKKATTTDGSSWGAEFVLSTGRSVILNRLPGGKLFAVYERGYSIYGRLYNGTAWESEVLIFYAGHVLCSKFAYSSIVDDSGKLHIVARDYRDGDIEYMCYDSSTGSWTTSSPSQVAAGSAYLGGLSINSTSQEIYLWYHRSNTIYYKKYSGGSWGSEIAVWTRTNLVERHWSVYANTSGSYVGGFWLEGTAPSYNVVHGDLGVAYNNPPNAPTLDSPAENARFDPSESVTFTWTFSDPDSGDSQSAFQLQLDDNSDFSSPIIDTGKVTSTYSSTTQTLPSTVGLYYWRVKTWDSSDAEGAWSSGRAIIIDRVQITLSVADSRIDIGSTMSWSYTATYEYDGADATSYVSVTLNDTTTKTSVGKWAFTVSSITESQYGLTVFDANTVECIWDRVQITLTPDDTRINVGSTGSYSFTATYEYDGADVSSFITINLNDTLTKSAVGKYGYTVSSITESQYGLTGFTSNSFYIIFDKLMVTLSIADSRINVGDTASISYTVTRQYDDSVSDATVTLNDTLTKNTVGKWAFTAESVSGDEYGITVFDSNIVTCIWDRVNINVFQVADPSIKVGEEAQFVVGGVYEYDGTVWSGTYTLNDTLTHSNIGKYVYRIASITDSIYGLTAFNQTAPDVYVLVGFNSLSLYQTNEQYKSEGKPYIQNTTDIITSLSYSPAKLTFNVDEIAEGEASITIVKGIGKAPQNLYIDGLTAPSKNTRDEFDSYGAKCWYYDSTNDLIYVKTYGSKIEILWKGYTPPPPSPPGGVPSAPPAMYGLVVTVTSMGEPAPDLKVEVYSDSRLVASGTTNANGIYSVSLNPGTYTVVVYLDGEKITETVTLDKTKTLSITVPAAPTIEITGFIQLAALLTVILIILTVAARFIRKE